MFEWTPTAGPGGRYTLEYALDPEFTVEVVTVENITDTCYAVPISSSLADSRYYWWIKAIDASGDQSGYPQGPYFFEVDFLRDTPHLINPAHMAVVNDATPELRWSQTAGSGGSYTLEYAPDSGFTHGVVTIFDLAETTYTVTIPLPDSTYHWHVKAVNHMGYESNYQAYPSQFTVDTQAPAVPALISPADSAWTNDPTPELVWSLTVGDGGTYTLEYALDSLFTTDVTTVPGLVETTHTVTGPLPDTIYYWHILATDAGGNPSQYQPDPYCFILDTQPPSVPLLITPEDLATVADCKPDFVWSSTAGAGGTYTLQYALNADFTGGIYVYQGLRQPLFEFVYPYGSLSDTTYYWRVEAWDRARNPSGFGLPFTFAVGAAGLYNRIVPLPTEFSFSHSYPNPFRSTTHIRYALPKECQVNLTVFNVRGQRVVTLVDEQQAPGYKMVRWDSRNSSGNLVASGVYYCRLQAGSFVRAKKLVMLK
jgi:hypothetical protein